MKQRMQCARAAVVALALAAGASAQPYRVTNLVSDGSVPAANTDPALINGWGIAFNPTGFVWVADNGSGLATLYDGHGVPQTLVVSIPSVPNSTDPGAPTGIVFSGGSDFVVSKGSASGPARFMFATEDGTISGWAPNVDLHHAQLVPSTGNTGAIYKGLTLAAVGTGHRLYATDFHNGRVDVFDGSFNPIQVPGGFSDPTLPGRFAPFGIQAIGDRIYVTYAMQDATAHDEVDGPGLGFVNVYDTDGNRIARVASRGRLNAPWGVALAPRGFGPHSGELLIGNFGDGRINTFRRDHADEHAHHEPAFRFAGALRSRGREIRIEGLWGMAFGNGVDNQPTNTLFFASGPNDEGSGLYGRIDFVGHD